MIISGGQFAVVAAAAAAAAAPRLRVLYSHRRAKDGFEAPLDVGRAGLGGARANRLSFRRSSAFDGLLEHVRHLGRQELPVLSPEGLRVSDALSHLPLFLSSVPLKRERERER